MYIGGKNPAPIIVIVAGAEKVDRDEPVMSLRMACAADCCVEFVGSVSEYLFMKNSLGEALKLCVEQTKLLMQQEAANNIMMYQIGAAVAAEKAKGHSDAGATEEEGAGAYHVSLLPDKNDPAVS